MNFIGDYDTLKEKYCIIEDHDMEVFEELNGSGYLEGLDSVEIIDIGAHDIAVTALDEVELIEALTLEGCEKHYELEELQKREINRNSDENENEKENEKPFTVKFREIEVTINTSTVEEVIFKKHRIEIIDKRSRICIMEGVVTGYQLVGRVYDPDIVLEFEDGRTFYNDNFGYLMLFYI
jgi:hypothetical protein